VTFINKLIVINEVKTKWNARKHDDRAMDFRAVKIM